MQVGYQWDFGSDNYSIEDFGFSLKEKGDGQERDGLIKKLQESTIPYFFRRTARTTNIIMRN